MPRPASNHTEIFQSKARFYFRRFLESGLCSFLRKERGLISQTAAGNAWRGSLPTTCPQPGVLNSLQQSVKYFCFHWLLTMVFSPPNDEQLVRKLHSTDGGKNLHFECPLHSNIVCEIKDRHLDQVTKLRC